MGFWKNLRAVLRSPDMVVPSTTYERAALRKVDTFSPEYRAFQRELYGKALERMGFQDVLAPGQELKLYSRLSGQLTMPGYDGPQSLDSNDLVKFRTMILQWIEDGRTPEEEERSLMDGVDGSDAVNEKVVSIFPSVEAVDGELYGIAVCRISGVLSAGELAELKKYCQSQYNDAWGEGFAQRLRRTEHGDLYVSFWRDNSVNILTKEEMEIARAPSPPMHQQKWGGNAK